MRSSYLFAGRPGVQSVGTYVLDGTHAKLRGTPYRHLDPLSPSLTSTSPRVSLACRASAHTCSTGRMRSSPRLIPSLSLPPSLFHTFYVCSPLSHPLPLLHWPCSPHTLAQCRLSPRPSAGMSHRCSTGRVGSSAEHTPFTVVSSLTCHPPRRLSISSFSFSPSVVFLGV